MIFLII